MTKPTANFDGRQRFFRGGDGRAMQPSGKRCPHDAGGRLDLPGRVCHDLQRGAPVLVIHRLYLLLLLRAPRRLLRGFMQIEMRRNGFRCSAGQRNEQLLCRLFRGGLLRRRCCFRVDPNCCGRDSCGTGAMVERLLLLLRLRLCASLAFLRCRTLGGCFRCWASLRPARFLRYRSRCGHAAHWLSCQVFCAVGRKEHQGERV